MGPAGEWQITWPTPLAVASDRLVIMHATHVASTLGNICRRDHRAIGEYGKERERQRERKRDWYLAGGIG